MKKLTLCLRLLATIAFVCLYLSCTRNADNNAVNDAIEQRARPTAILQTGEHPIWVQLTDFGLLFIESIEDAAETCAYTPWPLALHVRFYYERNEELVIAINRDGFIKFAPAEQGLALYRFPGGEFWKQYTIGGFVNYDDQDIALLYLDDRFLDSDAPLPNPRTWSFNMKSNSPFAVSIPALELFPVQDGWDIDALRFSDDGYWYYRVRKKDISQGEIQMIRTESLAQAGISISIEDFFNSAPQEITINNPSLPVLPEGFFYTGIGRVGDSLFASWEEQDTFNIGAAGFMLIKAAGK